MHKIIESHSSNEINKNLEIKKIHDILIESKIFKIHPSQMHIENIDFQPHHLCCIDEKIVIYLDYDKALYSKDRGLKISIMDWRDKKRPIISFENFLQITTLEIKEKLLFYITLFEKYCKK